MEKEYTLPKQFGEKWVEALRSGEYKQTTGSLVNTYDAKCE